MSTHPSDINKLTKAVVVSEIDKKFVKVDNRFFKSRLSHLQRHDVVYYWIALLERVHLKPLRRLSRFCLHDRFV